MSTGTKSIRSCAPTLRKLVTILLLGTMAASAISVAAADARSKRQKNPPVQFNAIASGCMSTRAARVKLKAKCRRKGGFLMRDTSVERCSRGRFAIHYGRCVK